MISTSNSNPNSNTSSNVINAVSAFNSTAYGYAMNVAESGEFGPAVGAITYGMDVALNLTQGAITGNIDRGVAGLAGSTMGYDAMTGFLLGYFGESIMVGGAIAAGPAFGIALAGAVAGVVLGSVAQAAYDKVTDPAFQSAAGNLLDDVAHAMGQELSSLADEGSALGQALGSMIQSGLDAAGEGASSLVSSAEDFGEALASGLSQFGADLMSGGAAAFETASALADALGSALGSAVGDAAQAMGDAAGNLGQQAADAVANAMADPAGALAAFFGGSGGPLGGLLGMLGALGGKTPPRGLPGSPPNFSDPLVLDLAGAGIDLSALSGSTAHFDYSGSGFAIHTGWVKENEGLLVLDDGQNDSVVTADELLGAKSGNGFQDLAALDANGDGVIDNNDPAFAKLKVWIDSGLDGQSGAGELYSLAALGITSIAVNATPADQNINGNALVATATFQKVAGDGTITTGVIGEVNFATDRQQSTYTPPAGFTRLPDTLKLPELAGYGTLPDLRVAMSLDPTLLAEVQNLIQNANTLSATDFDTAFQAMVQEWAGATDVDPTSRGPYVDARHMAVIYAFYGIDPSQDPTYNQNPNWHNGPAVWEPRYHAIIDELEARFVSQVAAAQVLIGADDATVNASPYLAFSHVQYNVGTDQLTFDLPSLLTALMQNAPSDPTAASAYWDRVLPIVKDLWVDYGSANALGQQFFVAATNLGMSTALQAEFYQTLGIGFADESTAMGIVASVPSNSLVLIGAGDKTITGSSGDVYVYSSAGGNDTIQPAGLAEQLWLLDLNASDTTVKRPGRGDDLVITNKATGATLTIAGYFSGHGLNAITFADGVSYSSLDVASVLAREAGDYIATSSDGVTQKQAALADFGYLSVIDATTTDPSFSGTAGDDAFIVGAGGKSVFGLDGADLIVSGSGDDSLNGGAGADTFIYKGGDGNDVITEPASYDSTVDKLVLGTGLTASGTTISRNGADLTLSFSGGGSVRLVGEDGSYAPGVEQIVFGDGVTWSRQDLENAYIAQQEAAGATSITGFDQNNDALTGTAGADTLSGQGGADTLTGGLGDDSLNGGSGADTYIYNAGDGNDTITDASDGAVDKLVLGTGLTPSNVMVGRSGADITLSFGGGSVDLVGEGSAYSGTGVEQIVFGDGTTWTKADLLSAASTTGTTGNNILYGTSANDIFDGKGGSDLEIGRGGSDSYIFNAGYGRLEIDNTAAGAAHGELDFGVGISKQDLWLEQSANNLVIQRLGSSDQVVVDNWFASASATLSEIKLSGADMLDSGLSQLVSAMATFAADNPGFDPATVTQMPSDAMLQSTIAASWHGA